MIHDITRELFSSPVYPGDPRPRRRYAQSLAAGDPCNLSEIAMCAHNATHLDAPLHFFEDGGGVETIPLEACLGPCLVLETRGDIGAETLASLDPGTERLLLKGEGSLLPEAAEFLAARGVRLVGTQALSVAAQPHTVDTHRTLLAGGVVILEGLFLDHVAAGTYTLCALPLKMAGVEGSPCRAVLMDRADL